MGMYMPEDHNHAAWVIAKKARSDAYNERKRLANNDSAKSAPQRKRQPPTKANLLWKKSFRLHLQQKISSLMPRSKTSRMEH